MACETWETCKTCKFLDVPPNKAGRIVVRYERAYSCIAPAPKLPKDFPQSIIDRAGFQWPPNRQSMFADDGDSCTVYEKRVKP